MRSLRRLIPLLLALWAWTGIDASVPRRSCAHEVDLGGQIAAYYDANSGFLKEYTPYHYQQLAALPWQAMVPGTFHMEKVLDVGQVLRTESEHAIKLMAKSADGRRLEFADMLGRRYVYHGRRGLLARLAGSALTRFDLEIATAAGRGSIPTTPLPELARDFALPANLDLFAAQLAERHVVQSTTYRDDASDENRRRMLAAQTTVNLRMLKLLRSGRPLRLSDLQDWNRTLMQSVNPTSQMEEVFYAAGGMIRGTEGAVNIRGMWVWIDLRTMPMSVAYMDGHSMRMLPPADAPARLAALLDRINGVDRNTSLRDILAIDRELFAIHGFLDSNGRGGRVVFDLCLLRAGFPPRPAVVGTKSLFLFHGLEEAERLVLEAYQNERR